MKKKIVTLVSALFVAFAAWADTVPGIQLVMDGGAVSIALSDISSITYPTETTVLFSMKAKETGSEATGDLTFLLDDVQRVVFADIEVENADATAIGSIEMGKAAKRAAKGFRVYRLNGALVRVCTDNRQFDEAVGSLPKGAYVIESQGNSFKIVKQ